MGQAIRAFSCHFKLHYIYLHITFLNLALATSLIDINSDCFRDSKLRNSIIIPQCQLQVDLYTRKKCVENSGMYIVLDEGAKEVVLKCVAENPMKVEISTENGKFLSYGDNERFVVVHKRNVTSSSEQYHTVTIPIIYQTDYKLGWSSPVLKYSIKTAAEDGKPKKVEIVVINAASPILFSFGSRKPACKTELVNIPCIYDYTTKLIKHSLTRPNEKGNLISLNSNPNTYNYNPFTGFHFNLSTESDLYGDHEYTCHGEIISDDANTGTLAQWTSGFGLDYRAGNKTVTPDNPKLECCSRPCTVYCEYDKPVLMYVSVSDGRNQTIPGHKIFETVDGKTRYGVEYMSNASDTMATAKCILKQNNATLYTWKITHYDILQPREEQTLRFHIDAGGLKNNAENASQILRCISHKQTIISFISIPCNNEFECEYYSNCIHEAQKVKAWQSKFQTDKNCSGSINRGKKCNTLLQSCMELTLTRNSSGRIFCTTDKNVSYERNYFVGVDGSFVVDPEHRNVSHTAVIKAHSDNEADFYANISYWFTCESASYYTEHGLQWKLKWRDGTLTFPNISESDDDAADDVWTSSSNPRRKSRIKLPSKDVVAIICSAPLINDNGWIEYEIDLGTVKSVNSSTIHVPANARFREGENSYIECHASGNPSPEVNWKWDENMKSDNIRVETNGSVSRLIFKPFVHQNEGDYICIASQDTFENFTKVFIGLKSNRAHHAVVTGVTIVLMTVAVVATIFMNSSRHRQERQETPQMTITDDEFYEFLNGIPDSDCQEECFLKPALALPYDDAYELDIDLLKIDTKEVLGKGNFGVVYKGVIIDPDKKSKRIYTAVKTLKSSSDKDHILNFLYEIKLMMYLGKHQNLVNMIGACTKNCKNGEAYLALEFCDHGTLLDHLQKLKDISSPRPSLELEQSPNPVLPNYLGIEDLPMCDLTVTSTSSFSSSLPEYANWPYYIDDQHFADLVRWSYEIACGMEYIARLRLIHGDLATRNVLLQRQGNKLIAKISDFGLSRKLYEYAHYVTAKQDVLPWRWLPPESIRQLKFSIKSDVWSYGICIWEIFSFGDVPYGGCSYSMEFLDLLDEGHRNPKPKIATPQLYDLMKKCWLYAADERPQFHEIKQFYEMEFGEDLSNLKNNWIEVPDSETSL